MDERTDERTHEQTNEPANVTALPVWLSPDDAAAALGCSVRQLQKLHKRDPQRWPRRRVGRRSEYRVRRTDERTDVRSSVTIDEPTNERASVVTGELEVVDRLLRMLEDERQAHAQTRGELDHARRAPVAVGNASAAEEARIARQSRAQVVQWLQRRGLWEQYLDDALGEDADRR